MVDEPNLLENFVGRINELCILNSISVDELVSSLPSHFEKDYLYDCIQGKDFPSDYLLVALSSYFHKGVDYFFEVGPQLNDYYDILERNKQLKVDHLSNILKHPILVSDVPFEKCLYDAVLEALFNNKISFSYAAYLLDLGVDELKARLC